MKELITILGLVSFSFAANAEVQLIPSQTRYCSQLGSEMTVREADNNNFEILLKKNGESFTLLAPVGGIAFGGQADIQDIQEKIRSRNLLAAGTSVKTVNSYGLSTLLSDESSIKAINTLSEGTLSSDDKIGVLESNGTIVFVGSESLCQ